MQHALAVLSFASILRASDAGAARFASTWALHIMKPQGAYGSAAPGQLCVGRGYETM
jgi:hypothetical protein